MDLFYLETGECISFKCAVFLPLLHVGTLFDIFTFC